MKKKEKEHIALYHPTSYSAAVSSVFCPQAYAYSVQK